jgi:hypothetical protein
VTDAVQRNSLLRAKPTGALFTRHEEPHIALQRRRLAHPLCRREVPRQGPGIKLATRPGGHILLVHPCLLGGASHPRWHLDPAPGSQDQLIDGQRRQQPIHSRIAPTPLPACARTSTSGNALCRKLRLDQVAGRSPWTAPASQRPRSSAHGVIGWRLGCLAELARSLLPGSPVVAVPGALVRVWVWQCGRPVPKVTP